MKVFFFPVGTFMVGSSRIRGLYMVEELRKLGADACILDRDKSNLILDIFKTYITAPLKALRYDAIIFQKLNNLPAVIMLYFFNLFGKITVYDIEDYANIEPRPRLSSIMIRKSKVVIAGNHLLEEEIKKDNPNCYFLPTCIDTTTYIPGNNNNVKPVIGWVGHGATHQENLKIVAKPLLELSKKCDFDFVVAGIQGLKSIQETFKDLKNAKLIDNLDWTNKQAVPNLLKTFDIGIYPIQNEKKHILKGQYKTIEYMAMGIPVVASPVGEATIQIEPGVDGYLAKDEQEWIANLENLLKNKKLRHELGKNGRKKVEHKYSFATNGKILYDILEKNIKH